jgi:hypothetical protein
MPPFAVEVIEDQIVVVATGDPEIRRGDIVVSVDGRPLPPSCCRTALGLPAARRSVAVCERLRSSLRAPPTPA